MPTKANLLTRVLIIFVALFALLIAYYWVHKPFDYAVLTRIGGAALDLATVAALFGIAGTIGRAALARLDLSIITRAERLALETGIGLGLIALATLIFGLVGLFRPLILWGLLIVIVLVLRKSLITLLLDLRDLARSAFRIESPGQALAALYCAILLVLALATALAPPSHWDSLTYHLVATQRYLRAGAITAQPDNFYLGLSENVEMLYSLTLGLFGRDTATAPVHFGLGMIALLATAGVVRRFVGRSAGWVAAVLLLSAYNLWALLGWAYVDLGALAYGALALITATAWRETITSRAGGRGWLILMGVIVGLAMGVKYTAAGLGVALGIFVLINQPRRVVQNGILMALAALLAFAPWAAKGLLLYHNPIYPFGFNGLNWNAGRMEAFTLPSYNLVTRGSAWQIPILPITATVLGQDLTDRYGFTVGSWLLMLFLTLPLVWTFLEVRAKRLALDALTLIIPLLIFWAVNAASNSVGIQTRLMAMALPAFAAAGAVALHGLAQFPKKPLDINFIVRVALMITLALGVLDAFSTVIHDQIAPYLLGQTDLGSYMYTNTGAYYNAVQNIPPNSRALLMWEPRGYYCPDTVYCSADVLFDNWKQPMVDEGLTADQVFERYRQQGYDYLLFFDTGYQQNLEFSLHRDLDEQFPAALERWMTPVWTDDVRYTIYGWKDE